jgi:hypothetical protein
MESHPPIKNYGKIYGVRFVKYHQQCKRQIPTNINVFRRREAAHRCQICSFISGNFQIPSYWLLLNKNYQFSNSLSFEMFDEIQHLRLTDISGIFNLPNGLRNVVTLELIDCAFTRIDALNPTKTLQDLRIVPKGDLTISTALDNIRSDYHVCLTFSKNCLNFDLSASRANVHYDDSSSMNKNLLYERLSLEINHWPNALDPKFVDDWQLYPDIDFVNRDTDDGDFYPPLTVHHGQILSLPGFSLSMWNNSLLLKIKRVF